METTTSWLIFSNHKNRLAFATKTGFHHVGLVSHDGKQWYCLEPLYTRMSFKVWNRPPTEDVPALLKRMGNTVVKITVKDGDPKGWRLNLVKWLFNCATMVQYCAGLEDKSLTPYKLYKRIMAGKDKNLISVEQI